MRFFNLTLTAPEADAYNAGYLEEKSLRADVARTLDSPGFVSARINTELEELKRSQSMSSLWKLHADALVVLLDIASTPPKMPAASAKTGRARATRRWRKAIHESVQKLRDRSDLAVKALAHPEARAAFRFILTHKDRRPSNAIRTDNFPRPFSLSIECS